MSNALFELGQTVKGLSWLADPWIDVDHDHADHAESQTMDISVFSNANLTMKVSDGTKVSSRYKFWDFRGAIAVFAGWEGLMETHCRRFETTRDLVIPLGSGNFTKYPLPRDYRWIYPDSRNWIPRWSNYSKYGGPDPRHKVIYFCKSGSACQLF